MREGHASVSVRPDYNTDDVTPRFFGRETSLPIGKRLYFVVKDREARRRPAGALAVTEARTLSTCATQSERQAQSSAQLSRIGPIFDWSLGDVVQEITVARLDWLDSFEFSGLIGWQRCYFSLGVITLLRRKGIWLGRSGGRGGMKSLVQMGRIEAKANQNIESQHWIWVSWQLTDAQLSFIETEQT